MLNDKYESFKILLGKVKEDVKITGPEVLRKEYPRAARIGDVVAKFFEEVSVEEIQKVILILICHQYWEINHLWRMCSRKIAYA